MKALPIALSAVTLWSLGGLIVAQDFAVVQVARDIVISTDIDSSVEFVFDDESIDHLVVETGWTFDECPIATCCQNHCHGVCRDPGHPKKPLIKKPGDRDRGDCPPLRYRMDDCQRAGRPHCYHRWAKCSVDGKYSAWFVGGGSPFALGRARTAQEGTWGLDYGGLFGYTKIWLNYTHGRNQGGIGAYRTDGEPKIVSRAHELLHLGHK